MLANYIQTISAFDGNLQNIFALPVRARAITIQNMGLADKIKELREKRHLTQQQLAKAVGVTYQSVQYWERGKGGAPRHKRLEKLASVLGVTVRDLVDADGERFPGVREDARNLLDELLNLAMEGKLSDNDISLIRSIVSRLSSSEQIHPMRRKTDRASDWIIGGPQSSNDDKEKTQ